MKSNEYRIFRGESPHNPMILAGKMKKPDVLVYSFIDYSTVTLRGLFRGRPHYGQIKVSVMDFVSALMNAGFEDLAHEVTALQKQV